MIKGLDHIGIAVDNIDEMLTFLKETFGAEELKRTGYPELQQISSVVNINLNSV
jgi:catechol 2,3-dioxygenase-like lactoylglutathione lyase family enzyme